MFKVIAVDGDRTEFGCSVTDSDCAAEVFRSLCQFVGTVSLIVIDRNGIGWCTGDPGKVIDQISIRCLSAGNRKKLLIACGKDALEILTLTPAGKKSMPVSAFLNGVRGENIEILPGVIPE